MAQKKQPVEYRLLVRPMYDETVKKSGFVFYLETTMQFTNFSYVVDVKDHVEGNTIVWSLHGLRAPSLNLPATGIAYFQKTYFDLPKIIHFRLQKNQSLKAEMDLKLSTSSVTSSKSKSTFLKIYTDEQEFESHRPTDAVIADPKPDIHREKVHQKTKRKTVTAKR